MQIVNMCPTQHALPQEASNETKRAGISIGVSQSDSKSQGPSGVHTTPSGSDIPMKHNNGTTTYRGSKDEEVINEGKTVNAPMYASG